MTNWAKSGKNKWQSDTQLGFYMLWSGFICANSQGWMQKFVFFCHAHWDKAIQQPWANSSNEFVLSIHTSEYFLELLPNTFHFWRSSARASQRSVAVNEGALFHLVQALEATSLGLFLNPYETPKVPTSTCKSRTSQLISLASILQIAHLITTVLLHHPWVRGSLVLGNVDGFHELVSRGWGSSISSWIRKDW